MPSPSAPRDLYVRFLTLSRDARAAAKEPDLDVMEERVLQSLAAVWAKDERITVLQAMSMGDDASPTTVQRRLKSLRRKGYLTLKEDESDNRVKFVTATPLTERHFDRLGRCMLEAASQT